MSPAPEVSRILDTESLAHRVAGFALALDSVGAIQGIIGNPDQLHATITKSQTNPQSDGGSICDGGM